MKQYWLSAILNIIFVFRHFTWFLGNIWKSISRPNQLIEFLQVHRIHHPTWPRVQKSLNKPFTRRRWFIWCTVLPRFAVYILHVYCKTYCSMLKSRYGILNKLKFTVLYKKFTLNIRAHTWLLKILNSEHSTIVFYVKFQSL